MMKTIWRWTLLLSTSLTLAGYAHAQTDAELVSISAVGDIMMGTDFPEQRLPPNDGARIFQAAKEYISAADVRFGNLEGTLYDGPPGTGAKRPGPNRYLFRSPTRYVNLLRDAGFNVVSLANNHIRDLGREGVQSTKRTLDDARIQYSSKDGEVAEFNIKGTRIALIATDYYDGRRSLIRPESTFKEIEELKKKFDIVIVSCHVGAEGQGAETLTFQNEIFLGENRGNPVAFAREAVTRGADLIVMHGPHVPRAMEVYRDRLIVYSLGNFATMSGISIRGANGYAPILRAQLARDGRFVKGHLASFQQDRPDLVRFDREDKAGRMMRELSARQFPTSAPRFFENGFFAPREAAKLP
ncbi:MAG: CapA family protein [Bdellovibrionaceae bacterium]|nr:CapA family protein [Pseudobdellovibrionaceae bacterium]